MCWHLISIIPLNLNTVKKNDYLHYTDKEAEDQSGKIICLLRVEFDPLKKDVDILGPQSVPLFGNRFFTESSSNEVIWVSLNPV